MNVKILTLVIVLVVSLLCSASAGKYGARRLLPPCVYLFLSAVSLGLGDGNGQL